MRALARMERACHAHAATCAACASRAARTSPLGRWLKKVPSYLPRAAAAAGVTAADTAGWGGWGIARIYALNRVEGGGLSWGGGG